MTRITTKTIGLLAVPMLGSALVAYRAVPDQQQALNITVPQGFAVEQVLSPADAQSIVALTFDNQGRMVLGKEFGNVVTLIPNGSGGFEQRIFTEEVHTSQGLYFDGSDLIFDGVGPQGVGLYRVTDDNGDARGERVELIELSTGTIGDHGPHAPFYGPDGHMYWTHGNFSSTYSEPSPLSPVRIYKEASLLERPDPRGFGSQYEAGPGALFMRKALPSKSAGNTPDAGAAGNQEWELFAHGMRNQYDGAFNLMGELFTFDSDMEWDRDLPWYRGTALFHVVPGADFGYREGTGKHPWYYPDVLPPLEDLGRGSPTGVTMLQTYNYPAEYWDYMLSSDWSRGRVVGTRLVKSGATYQPAAPSTNFMYGEPLNVTDLEVGPDGNLYFTLGGRSTGGGVYRLVYRGNDAMQRPAANTPIDRVLTMIQPRSPFSRELARTTKAQMGGNWERQLDLVVRNAGATPERRVRAMELLQVFGPELDEADLVALRADPSWEVRAASTYYLGLKTSETAQRELVARLKDNDPFVVRRAAEALVRTGVHPIRNAPIDPVADVFPLLASPDRFVQHAGRTLLKEINPNRWKAAAMTATGQTAVNALIAYIDAMESPDVWDMTQIVRRDLELLQANPSGAELMGVLRLIQRTILESNGVTNFPAGASAPGNMQNRQATGLQGGAQPRPAGQAGPGQGGPGAQQQTQPPLVQIGTLLLSRFPSADSMLNREIARTVAALETPGATAKIAAELSNPRNGREQQIHYAWVLSFMRSGWDATTTNQMTAWLEKVYGEQWRGGASFSNAMNMIRDGFLDNVPPEQYTTLSQRIQTASQPRVAAAPAQPAAAPAGGAAPAPAFVPPTSESDEEIYESLVFRPDFAGSPAGGAAAYVKAACASCHTFGPIGTEFGPDLTTVNQRFGRRDLVRAIMFPNEQVSDLYQAHVITRTNGTTVTGIINSETPSTITVGISGGAGITIPKTEIRSRVETPVSVMPHGLMRLLTGAEQRNLIALLQAGPAAIPDSARTRLGR
ncbi:MAG: HEAT repeat domain-containing protein [Gemmatimonadetes bacterium]|nr:HEAT repeat domain-containing protein [Gemmatimonadota bacterium]